MTRTAWVVRYPGGGYVGYRRHYTVGRRYHNEGVAWKHARLFTRIADAKQYQGEVVPVEIMEPSNG